MSGDGPPTVPQPAEPADFTAFWRRVRNEVVAVPTRATLAAEGVRGGRRMSAIAWVQRDGVRVGGWLVEPATAARGALVIGHGYAGRATPDAAGLPVDFIGLFPCMPGFNRSAQPGIPATADAHVLHGIGDRDAYVLRDCVEASWRAFDVLAERYPGLPLFYLGTSFGGGLGALLLPWEARCTAAALEVPTFGNHPVRLATPCTGSGEAVRRHHAQHPGIADVLAYYDAAVAARHIRCPVLVAPADIDPAVPPAGQWSVARAIPGAVIHPLSAGHPTPGREAAQLARAIRAFFAGFVGPATG